MFATQKITEFKKIIIDMCVKLYDDSLNNANYLFNVRHAMQLIFNLP